MMNSKEVIMTRKIDSKEISIIIQGKIFESKSGSTLDVLQSIRKYYPQAEIILSTWKGTKLPLEYNVICDQIVLSDDPGDGTYGKTPLNINRQIVSSKLGLERATRTYAIKTRTDLKFTSDSLISFMELDLDRSPKFSLGSSYICVADFTTRDHKSGLKIPFWVCDFVYAGKTKDVQKIFDVELYKKRDFEYYLTHAKPDYMYRQSDVFQYAPETYLAFHYLKRNRDIPFENSYDRNPVAMKLYSDLLINNFIVLGEKQLGIISLKYRFPFLSIKKTMTYPKWVKLYSEQYKTKIPKPYFLQDTIEYLKYKWHKNRNLRNKDIRT